MKFLIVLLILIVVAHSQLSPSLYKDEWKRFKERYRKKYDEVEDKIRTSIYIEKRQKVEKHNQKYKTGSVSYALGTNKYSDMLDTEFITTRFGLNSYNRSQVIGNKQQMKTHGMFGKPIFARWKRQVQKVRVDWRSMGAVTPVKDQKYCGCCWAFSATGSLESAYFLKYGVLSNLSEQNLVDCTTPYGNYGCGGGLMDNAFQYVKVNGGLEGNKTYPYEGTDGTCRYNYSKAVFANSGFATLPMGDEKLLQQAVATIGPISIGVDASGWELYKSGIYSDPSCSSMNLNHGVLLVGYDVDANGNEYWIIKNSWGTSWGIGGYIHLARNKNNMCGVATLGSYPVL